MATGKPSSRSGKKPRKSRGSDGSGIAEDTEIVTPAKSPKQEEHDTPVVIEGEAVEITPDETTPENGAVETEAHEGPGGDDAGQDRQPESDAVEGDDTAQPVATPENGDMSDRSAPAVEPEITMSEARNRRPAAWGSGRGLIPFVGFVTGGVVAAVFGYGLSEYLAPPPPPDRGAEIAALKQQTSARLDALEKRVSALEARPEDTALDTALSRMQAAVDSLRKALDRQSGDLGSRLGEAEKRLAALSREISSLQDKAVSGVATVGNAGAEFVDRIQSQIDSLKKQLQDEAATREALARQIDKVSTAVNDRLASAQKKVAELSQAAQEAARTAEVTRMSERLRAAVDTGRAYGQLLGTLARDAAVQIPEALKTGAKTGVPTMAQLEQDFPPAARRALKASIEAQANGGRWERFQAWLKAQIGARSLAPRQGDDPDAILSRAEAALRAGQLKKAIDLVQTLPPAGVAEMRDWLDAANRRLAVQTALETLESALKTGQQKEAK